MGQGVSLKRNCRKNEPENLTPDVDLVENMFRCLISTDRLCSCPDILIILTRIVYRLSDMLNIRIFRHLRKRKR